MHIPVEDGTNLVAIFTRPKTKKPPIVVMLHGFAGNKDENGLFQHAAECLHRNGFATMRIDLRGCGESNGDLVNANLELLSRDFHSIIEFVREIKEINSKRIYVIGFSLGATIAIMGYSNKIEGMVLWSPVLFPKKDMYPRYCTPSVQEQVEKNGYFIKSGLKVGHSILKDIENCDLLPYIKRIDCPILIAHGGQDNKIDIKSSEEAVQYFKRAELTKYPEACHSFKGDPTHKLELYKTTATWFKSLNSNHRCKKKTSGDQLSIHFGKRDPISIITKRKRISIF